MNLRLSVLVFLLLSTLSTVASASWFSGYQTKEANKGEEVTSVSAVSKNEYNHHGVSSYPVIQRSDLSSHQKYHQYLQQLAQNPMSVYFLPQVQAPTAILAPSFDVVAREMQQIQQKQIADDQRLVSYVYDRSIIHSTMDAQ